MLAEALDALERQGLRRERVVVTRRHAQYVDINGETYIDFSTNDYLGLTQHPCLLSACKDALEQYGVGAGSSVQVSGFTLQHQQLENSMANFFGTEKALLFNSGYHANLGVLTTLAKRHDTVVSDKLCHASILDGIQLSRATHKRYPHQNLEVCERLLSNNALLITEGVFSMEGDIADLARLAALAQQKKAFFMVDDAHGVGVLGKTGRGSLEYCGLTATNVACLIVPLGKAFGTMGAIVAGSHHLIDALQQFARTYRYTTGLPPAVVCATREALDVLQQETWRREKLQQLIGYFNQRSMEFGLPLISQAMTPIRSLLIGDANRCLTMQAALKNAGFLVAAIRPPTVPSATARLRLSLNCMHTIKDIDRLLTMVAQQW